VETNKKQGYTEHKRSKRRTRRKAIALGTNNASPARLFRQKVRLNTEVLRHHPYFINRKSARK